MTAKLLFLLTDLVKGQHRNDATKSHTLHLKQHKSHSNIQHLAMKENTLKVTHFKSLTLKNIHFTAF